MMMKTFIISTLSIFLCFSVHGQVEFFDGTAQVLGEEELYSTICIGFEDLNNDLRDDLFLLDEGKILKTFIQGSPLQTFNYTEHLQVSPFGDWSFISGDLDNDDIPEIICNGNDDGSQFLKFDGTNYNTSFTTESVFSQNSNLVDLNLDGYLDFFVCNDDGESLFFINDGTGGMIETKLINFQTSESDDMSGNYSSIFTDIDNDNDLDLYIGKCRAGVTDPTDPRRVNTLYINNGDGTYTESGKSFGLDIGAQSWSLDAGDVDNDGDIDILVANHDRPHDLMINDGNGHFDRKQMIPEGYTSFAYQSFFCDFDNNGWLDIFITDPSNTFILFNDEMSFTRRDLLGDSRKAFSGATGDLNSDGFPDLYLGFGNSFQSPSDIPDKVLLNEGNTNNYLDVNLVGTVSNRNAIGAKVILFHDEVMLTREITAGKSYGIMNSTIAHFGLGKLTFIDSILVKWPSGNETLIIDDIEVNTLISITEDECAKSRYLMPDLQLCNGDSIEVTIPLEFENVNWSNGATTSNIWISEPGWYNVEFEDGGCLVRSSYFEVREEEDLDANDVLAERRIVACQGDIIELESYPGTNYYWSTGDTSRIIEVSASGVYNLELTTNCNNFISNDVDIFFANNQTPFVENDSILEGNSATFTGSSESTNWYQNKNDIEPLDTGIEFTTPPIFEDQTFYVGEPTVGFGFNKSLMTNVPLNDVGDSIYIANEFVEFEVLDRMILYSIKVRTQTAGIRKIVLMEDDNVLAVFDVNLIVGINSINLDYVFEPGTYSIGTDILTNQNNFGTDHPQLSYSSIYSNADKEIADFLEIKDSEINPNITHYFFDWVTYYGYYYCEPRVPVNAVIKEPVSTKDVVSNSIVYPNPTSGQLTIKTEMNLPISIDVLDISGARAIGRITGNKSNITIDMPVVPGLYFLKITNGHNSEIKKIYVY